MPSAGIEAERPTPRIGPMLESYGKKKEERRRGGRKKAGRWREGAPEMGDVEWGGREKGNERERYVEKENVRK